jgi:hypothetical protein
MIPITHPFRKVREKDGAPSTRLTPEAAFSLGVPMIPVTHPFRKVREKGWGTRRALPQDRLWTGCNTRVFQEPVRIALQVFPPGP